jgi:hypothetical protein
MATIVDIIAVVGSLCSIIALALTIGIFVKLRHINRDFLFQARFPTLKKNLTSHRSTLSKLLNTFPNSSGEIAVELQKLVATLKSLISKVDRARRASTKDLLKRTQMLSCSSLPASQKQVRDLYLGIVLVEEELANFSKDFKWRPSQ